MPDANAWFKAAGDTPMSKSRPPGAYVPPCAPATGRPSAPLSSGRPCPPTGAPSPTGPTGSPPRSGPGQPQAARKEFERIAGRPTFTASSPTKGWAAFTLPEEGPRPGTDEFEQTRQNPGIQRIAPVPLTPQPKASANGTGPCAAGRPASSLRGAASSSSVFTIRAISATDKTRSEHDYSLLISLLTGARRAQRAAAVSTPGWVYGW